MATCLAECKTLQLIQYENYDLTLRLSEIFFFKFKSGSSGTSYTCTASSSKYVVYTKQSTFSYDDETNYKSLIYGRDYGAFVAVPDTNGDLSSAYLNQTIAVGLLNV